MDDNKLTCTKCKQKKTRDDFYWRKKNPTVRTSDKCKTCISADHSEKVKERQLF